jgi:putative SOS response-associated peptidase YedK
MCGAFSIIHPFRELGRRFNAGYNEVLEVHDLPRYNARPTQILPMVVNQNSSNLLEMSQWGLTPSFMEGKVLFNTRADSLATKVYFKRLYRTNRCLIPSDGFYEWATIENKKQPFRFSLKTKEIFAFAGIYTKNEKTKELNFSIITTEPNKLIAKVHNRMPVILTKKDEQAWIGQTNQPESLLKLLSPYPAHLMSAYPVSTLVNSPKNDQQDIIKPLNLV